MRSAAWQTHQAAGWGIPQAAVNLGRRGALPAPCSAHPWAMARMPPPAMGLWRLPWVFLLPGACKVAPAFLRLRGTCHFGSAILCQYLRLGPRKEFPNFDPGTAAVAVLPPRNRGVLSSRAEEERGQRPAGGPLATPGVGRASPLICVRQSRSTECCPSSRAGLAGWLPSGAQRPLPQRETG